MSDITPAFLKCSNCGRVFNLEESGKGSMCSNACAERYSRCVNCGKYFLQGTGHSNELCSSDCSIVYIVIKKYDEEKYTYFEEKESA
jgi:hypothetical protein